MQVDLVGVDLGARQIGGGVAPDEVRLDGTLIAELDVDLTGARDYVGVREDVAVAVDHEPGTGRRAAALRDRGDRGGRLGGAPGLDVGDARGGPSVDVVDGQSLIGERGL